MLFLTSGGRQEPDPTAAIFDKKTNKLQPFKNCSLIDLWEYGTHFFFLIVFIYFCNYYGKANKLKKISYWTELEGYGLMFSLEA